MAKTDYITLCSSFVKISLPPSSHPSITTKHRTTQRTKVLHVLATSSTLEYLLLLSRQPPRRQTARKCCHQPSQWLCPSTPTSSPSAPSLPCSMPTTTEPVCLPFPAQLPSLPLLTPTSTTCPLQLNSTVPASQLTIPPRPIATC
jgi:hypothetical protein